MKSLDLDRILPWTPAALLLGWLALGPLGAAQEQGPPPVDLEGRIRQDLGQDPAAQMQELFGRIEKNLRKIDDLLFEAAGAPEVAEDDPQRWRAWVGDTRERSEAVLEDIDKLLDLSQQMSSQSRGRSSSNQGQGQQSPESSEQGQSPLDRGGPEGQRRQEGGQQGPPPPESGQGEQGSGPEGQGQQPPPGGAPQDGTPSGAEQGGPEGQRGSDRRPAGSERGPGSQAGEIAPWGELPPRVQEIFSNQNAEEMPLLYRDWIDSYYRRVSREP
jgi:hypothetical protein